VYILLLFCLKTIAVLT